MQKTLLITLFLYTSISWSGKKHLSEQTKQTQEPKTFDWSNVPITDSDIGVFPYFTPPEGTKIGKGYSGDTDVDFGKLQLFVNNEFLTAEGRVKSMSIQPSTGNYADWNQYKFDSSIDKYLLGIGAKLISKGKIPGEKLKELGAESVARFIPGDPYNNEARVYAVNHPEQKFFVFISSSSASANIGVVKLADFEQTITKITAEDIKKQLDDNGLVTLYLNFHTGKSRIKQESYEIIAAVQKMLEQHPDLNISIEGHTDDVGTVEDNLRLSENRARSVVIALSDEGVDENRLSYKGFGQSMPLSDNNTEEGKAKNRRVEIKKMEL